MQTTKTTPLQKNILNKMKKNTTQLTVTPLDGEIRAVLIDHDGRTYGTVRADTLQFLVRKNMIRKIKNEMSGITYGLTTQ